MNIFQVVLIAPMVNILMFFYKVFTLVGVPAQLGFSIIAVTTLARLAINPLMNKQLEQSKKMQELQPKIAKLQKKYKAEPAKLQQAQMELYKSYKINPGSGCLVFLIQLPLMLGLYNALADVVNNSGTIASLKNINKMLYSSWLKVEGINVSFLNFNLTKTPADWQTWGWWYLLIPVITAGLQMYQAWLSSKSMTPVAPVSENKDKSKKDQPADDAAQMQSMMQKQMIFFFPLMIGWISYRFPIGVALYWNIFNIFGIWQYWQQNRETKAAR